jgi:hypothetical protein
MVMEQNMKLRVPRRPALIVGVLSAALVAILVVSYAVVISVIDSDHLEGVFNSALTPVTDGLYRVEVGAIDISPLARTVELADLQLHVREEALDRLAAVGAVPPLRAQGMLGRVAIEGVDLVRLALDRDFEARAFRVEAPHFQLTMIPRLTDPAAAGTATEAPQAEHPSDPAAPSDPAGLPSPAESAAGVGEGEAEPSAAPRIEIGELSLADVDVTLVIEDPGSEATADQSRSLTNDLRGLSVRLLGLAVDPTTPIDRSDLASFAKEAELAFESLRLDLPGELNIAVEGFHVSTATEALDVERFALAPDASVEDFLAGAGPPGDRIELAAGPISFQGMEFLHFLRTLEARVQRGSVENLDLQVLSDKQRTQQTSGPRGPQFMPHAFVQGLPVGIDVDTLQITSGSVVYAERGLKSDEPGWVPLTDIDATLTNISNEPERMSVETPMVLQARLRGFESAPVAARIEMPLLEAPPTMHVQAWVGGFPATEVNSVLPNLEGLRVTEGRVDTAWVSIQYGRRRASGSVVALYGDARIQMEQAGSGKQNLLQKAASFAANTVAIRHDNRPKPGDTPRSGKVDYEILPDKPFFGVLWEALREGVLDLVIAL